MTYTRRVMQSVGRNGAQEGVRLGDTADWQQAARRPHADAVTPAHC